MDETAPAYNTLADYPSVVTWRLKANASIPNNAVINSNMNALKTTVTVIGYNSRGNQVASGVVNVGNPNNLNSWYCTGCGQWRGPGHGPDGRLDRGHRRGYRVRWRRSLRYLG